MNEVKAIGRVDSAIRTATQTQLSLLWAASGLLEQSAVARSLVPQDYELVDTARLFALMNFAACDGMIAAFDAKYHYGFWRPFHAIRLADTDGNAATTWCPSATPASLTIDLGHVEEVSGFGINLAGAVPTGLVELSVANSPRKKSGSSRIRR